MHGFRRRNGGGVGLRETNTRTRDFWGIIKTAAVRGIFSCSAARRSPLVVDTLAFQHRVDTLLERGQAGNTWGEMSDRSRGDVHQTLTRLQPG